MPNSTREFTLPASTIHISKDEIYQLLIQTAQSKVQLGWKFALIESDNYGGYNLTFIKTKKE